MPESPPTLIAIDHDDYHAEFVGKTSDGRQFFLTNPFVPRSADNPGREFLALYIFDSRGVLIEAKIEDFGTRPNRDHEMDLDSRESLRDTWLNDLGPKNYQRIQVAPFSLERFGTTFGLISEAPSEDRDTWIVTVEPGNFMAFFEPWDSGIYDT